VSWTTKTVCHGCNPLGQSFQMMYRVVVLAWNIIPAQQTFSGHFVYAQRKAFL